MFQMCTNINHSKIQQGRKTKHVRAFHRFFPDIQWFMTALSITWTRLCIIYLKIIVRLTNGINFHGFINLFMRMTLLSISQTRMFKIPTWDDMLQSHVGMTTESFHENIYIHYSLFQKDTLFVYSNIHLFSEDWYMSIFY